MSECHIRFIILKYFAADEVNVNINYPYPDLYAMIIYIHVYSTGGEDSESHEHIICGIWKAN